jgi:hypothetical protein
MPELYAPSPGEKIQAQEAYIRYMTGAVLLHDPDGTHSIHRRDISKEDQLEEMVAYSEHLMLMGLQDVLRLAHGPSERQNLGDLEGKFECALPNMQETVTRTFDLERERVDALSPALWIIRPAPMVSCSVYKVICHSRKEKLKTKRLVDDLSIDSRIAPYIEGRNLAHTTPSAT